MLRLAVDDDGKIVTFSLIGFLISTTSVSIVAEKLHIALLMRNEVAKAPICGLRRQVTRRLSRGRRPHSFTRSLRRLQKFQVRRYDIDPMLPLNRSNNQCLKGHTNAKYTALVTPAYAVKPPMQ